MVAPLVAPSWVRAWVFEWFTTLSAAKTSVFAPLNAQLPASTIDEMLDAAQQQQRALDSRILLLTQRSHAIRLEEQRRAEAAAAEAAAARVHEER